MYRCKECGCEYEEKPEYCDCGNDEFVLIQKTPSVIKEDIKPKKEVNKTVPPPAQKQVKNNTNNNNIREFLNSIDILSGSIFLVCIVLSLYVVFFAWNVEQNENTENKTAKTTVVSKQIPPIDSFWNNQLPKQEVKTVEEKPVEAVKAAEIPKITKVELKKIPVKQISKPAVKAAKTTATKTNVQNTKTTVNKTPQVQKPQTVNNIQQPPQTAVKTIHNQKSAAEIAAEEAAKKAAATQKAALLKQEYTNYKVGLRNTIGRKIDFTRVVGDGSCTVAFKINSNGKLVNRSFAKQSSNITLNDAVYAAVMSTPTYNPPPAGYNNEILNLNIKFYNGNFEITLN